MTGLAARLGAGGRRIGRPFPGKVVAEHRDLRDIGIGFASVIWGVINDSFGFQTSIVCVIVCLIASYASAWIVYPARDKRWRH